MSNVVTVSVQWEDKSGATAAASARKTGEVIGQTAKSAQKNLKSAEVASTGFSGSLKRMSEVAGGITIADTLQNIGQKARQFLGDSKNAASDLNESVNAVNVVFGNSAGKILQWGQANANAFGLSQREFNQKVVPLGALLKNTGMSMDEVSDNSINLTKRAADMASVFNTDVGTALDAIQAGLRGELDPLEQFGVKLSAADIESKALAMTGKTVASSLTEQEKAAARVAIIMDQTAAVQGDFANTSDSAANASRRAAAATEEFKAKIGSALLPIVAAASNAVVGLTGAFGHLPGVTQGVIGGIITVVAAVASFAPTALVMGGALAQMGIRMATFRTAMSATTSFIMGPWGIALGAGGIAVALFGDQIGDAMNKARDGIDNLVDGISGVPGGMEAVRAAQAERTGAADKDTDAQQKNTGATDSNTSAQETSAEAIKEATDALNKKIDATIAASDAEIGFEQALDDATQAAKDNGKTTDLNTEKGRNNRTALNNLATASNNYIRQLKEQNASTTKVTGATDRARVNFFRVAAQMGITGNKAVNLASDYGLIPKNINTRVQLIGWLAAKTNADAFARAIKNIPTTHTTTLSVRGANINGSGGHMFLEHGGITSTAQTGGARHASTVVNEAGPEVIDLPDGSKVATAGATRALAEMGAFAPRGGAAAIYPTFLVELHIGGQRITEMIDIRVTQVDARTRRAITTGRGNAR